MRAVIAGGGIGGLALAQGLTKNGIETVVLERDLDVTATGGYKLHLGPSACEALRSVLTPSLVEALYASSVETQGFSLAVRDHRGRLLVSATDGQAGASLDVDRITLRVLLARDLGSRLRLGVTCASFEELDDRVEVTLDSGEIVDGDVLIIADGAGSVLAQQLAGEPTASPTGLVGIAGRTRAAVLPASSVSLLAGEPTLAIGPDGIGVFASAHDPRGASAIRGESMAVTTEPVVIWGLISVVHHLPEQLNTVPAERLQDLGVDLLRSHRWVESLQALPERAETDTVAGFRFLAADPGTLAPWQVGRVSALGDAVHAMPPTGGQGAATAVRDTALLTERLVAAHRGETTTAMALYDYTTAMRGYAATAVRESLQPVGWIKGGATPLGRAAAMVALPAIARAARVVRRVRGTNAHPSGG